MNHTPLHDAHLALGARMTEFGGWDMPVWYQGIPAEHEAVRTRVGLFDVSHMGEFVVHGIKAEAALRRLLTNDVAALAVGEAQYTLLPNASGGTVDDLIAYRLGPQAFVLVVNASNIAKDRDWLRAHLGDPRSAGLDDHSDRKALVALQGPKAEAVLMGLTRMPVQRLAYYHFDRGDVAGVPALVSRTGYTGEDGFELMCEAEDARTLWDALLQAGAPHGIAPAGLGARDSLRLEAAMPLYGHELDDETSALEAGLSRFVILDKPGLAGPQMGGERLRAEAEGGLRRKLVGLMLEDRGVPRQGFAIHAGPEGEAIGEVTSGTLAPTLGRGIALGYVPPEHGKVGTALSVAIRDRLVPATVVKRPFYRRPR